MNWERIFSLSHLLVLPFWALMIFAPRWRWTQRIMRSLWVMAPIALLYAILVLPQLGALGPTLAQPSAAGVAAGLGQPAGATIGWVHFLAFDLFVGRRVYLDSRQRGRNAWWMGVVLLFTFMLGPIGLLLYLGDRALVRGAQPSAKD